MGAARKPHDCEPATVPTMFPLWLITAELEDFDELESVERDLNRADELANGLRTEETIP